MECESSLTVTPDFELFMHRLLGKHLQQKCDVMNERGLALGFIAGCLSVRTVSDADRALSTIIGSGRLDWSVLTELADAHLVTPALWVAIRQRGFAGELPFNVREYFWKIYLLNALRNRRLKDQAIAVVRVLNSIGIEPILLKGGAFLFDNTFGYPSSRVMADLDILVPQEAADRCWDTLRSKGYMPAENDYEYSDHHHLRPLVGPGDQGAIEIHREVLPESAAAIMPSDLVWRHAKTVRECGVAFQLPAPTHWVLHNVLHACLVNRAHARADLSLRSLHELVLVQRKYAEQIDWAMICELMRRGGKAHVLEAWLHAAHRLFSMPLPEGVRITPRSIAHYARMRLQARWGWIDEIVEKAMWFSASDICERYQCGDDLLSLARGRLQLAAMLSRKLGIHALRRARRVVQYGRSVQRPGSGS